MTAKAAEAKASTNGHKADEPTDVLVQVQVTVVFAPLTPAGIGVMSQPVSLTIDAASWSSDWATDKSREVFANILGQLKNADAAPAL